MPTEAKFDLKSEEVRPPVVEATDPVTGAPILLLDPYYKPHEPKLNKAVCEDAESFAAVVLARAGGNKLVELTTGGTFRYAAELSPACKDVVSFALKPSEIAYILGLKMPKDFDQQALIRFHAQYPDALAPDVPDGTTATHAAMWDFIKSYETKGVTRYSSIRGERSISIVAENAKTPNLELPPYWTATAPVFDGHAEQTVTLRLDEHVPEPGPDGKLQGVLKFEFSLWQPSASEVMAAALADAMERMRDLLPEFTIIRGSIG